MRFVHEVDFTDFTITVDETPHGHFDVTLLKGGEPYGYKREFDQDGVVQALIEFTESAVEQTHGVKH